MPPRPTAAPERPQGELHAEDLADPFLPAGARPAPNAPGEPPPIARNGHPRRGPKRDVLPHDPQAERSLLGAAMLGAHHILDTVPDDAFYVHGHTHIARAIRAVTTAGETPDSVTVSDHLRHTGLLDEVGGPAAIAAIMAETPATTAAPSYARIVTYHHRARILIHAGDQITHTAREQGPDAAYDLLRPLLDTQAPAGVDRAPDPDLDDFLGMEEDDFDWLVPGLLERGDRVILTGPEGGGKSTLLRQIAIQLASGIDPFTLEPITPMQVLYVDCENSPRQARRALRNLRDTAGDSYINGKLRLRVLGHSIDLAKPDVMADIGARITEQDVDILIIGPLYKLLADDPVKEMPAKAVADAIDWLRSRRDSAILIEAHSPYADGHGKTRPIRPYGASLWSRWPEFGFHLDPEGKITHWRGQRDERSWPTALERSTTWPWAIRHDTPNTWDGPTECIAAVVAFINEAGGDHSTRQLVTRLRERGLSFRDNTISTSARIAHERGLIDQRTGPRGALIYSPAMPSLGTLIDEEF